jgi:homoserine dehydrogenase
MSFSKYQAAPITVLKFGSSVLRSEADLPAVVHEIYAELRLGRRVLVVPSAFGSTTDDLLALAKSQTPVPEPRVLARLLATGESTSAALLSLALKRAGVAARLIGPEVIGLETEGGYLDAHPVGLDVAAVEREFEAAPVLVLPGFISRRTDGELALLGRGGSDLTAIFVASRIGAARCVLVKDVEGLFEWDPAGSAATPPRRYGRISYGDALGLSGDVVQHKAIRLAREADLSFEVSSASSLGRRSGGLDSKGGALAGVGTTLVGAAPSSWDETETKRFTRLRVGLIGHGTVGSGVLEHLFDSPEDFEVVGVLVRDIERHRQELSGTRSPAAGLFDELFTTNAEDLLGRGLDVLVEVAGGIDPVAGWLETALGSGISVVSANKALFAEQGIALEALAEKTGASLAYSAAVGGSAPLLERAYSLRRAQKDADFQVRGIEAVLNSTTNYVLDAMLGGTSFEQSIAEAQANGFAEADPTLDINGTDTAQKIELLARAIYGSTVVVRWGRRLGIDSPDLEELLGEARGAEGLVRLVASCYLEDNDGQPKVLLEVVPVVLPASSALARIRGAGSSAIFELASSGQKKTERVFVSGEGAGCWATAESVMADLLDLRRDPSRAGARAALSSCSGTPGQ